jgi:hypothetical protein
MEQFTNLIVILGGAQVILTALIAFTGKMWLNYLHEKQKGQINTEIEQIKANLQATNLRLQAALDTRIHIHKVQLETELKVYKEIWDILIEVRKSTASLRPLFDSTDSNETADERKHRRLTNFGNDFQKFIDQVNKERPFYPEEIYSKLHNLITTVQEEAIEYQYGEPKDLEYWKKAKKNSEVINQHIDEICEAIRQRLAKVSVA